MRVNTSWNTHSTARVGASLQLQSFRSNMMLLKLFILKYFEFIVHVKLIFYQGKRFSYFEISFPSTYNFYRNRKEKNSSSRYPSYKVFYDRTIVLVFSMVLSSKTCQLTYSGILQCKSAIQAQLSLITGPKDGFVHIYLTEDSQGFN